MAANPLTQPLRIRNTTEIDPVEHLVEAMADYLTGQPLGSSIERLEARGQAELCASTQLPVEMWPNRAAFEVLGIVFGEPSSGDPLFLEATLPAGWRKVPAPDHSMWSYIVDADGKRRAAVFYKAASYDRRAYMRLEEEGTP